MNPGGENTGSSPPAAAGRCRTGLVYDPVYLLHDTGLGHPEKAGRLTAIVEHLQKAGLMEQLVAIEPGAATAEQLEAVHSKLYVEWVAEACREGETCLDAGDTRVSSHSYEAALLAAGGVMAACDAVMAGRVVNAFCAVRPPGHHSRRDRAMGFCIFNNIAVAVRHLQRKHKIERMLIVDWDVHHGNGTQEAFYEDPGVLRFDLHQSPHYPGSGAVSERGAGNAVGRQINVPLPAGADDADFLRAMETMLCPAAIEFEPQFVLVSAGFDAHRDDPLGGLRVTTEGFARMTEIVAGIAMRSCKGRLVSTLEGGYRFESLAASVEAHLRALMAAWGRPR